MKVGEKEVDGHRTVVVHRILGRLNGSVGNHKPESSHRALNTMAKNQRFLANIEGR